jgi:catechol 2,3-dioxygenase-like lactoylglutathione lyase family enzyme
MQLNHLHLMVSDAQGSAAFLARYFSLRQLPGGKDKLLVMTDDAGMILTLMQGRDCAYPKNFHIGFGQASEAGVDRIWRQMQEDGIDCAKPERAHAYSFYARAPGGFLVEVLAA